MSAQDATIFLAAAIAFIIPLAGYAAHLHFEAKRQAALAEKKHADERLQARKNILENLLLLATALEYQQVNLTEGCLRIRVFLDLLDEGIHVHSQDFVVFDWVYQKAKHLATHQERSNLAPELVTEQDQQRLAIEKEFATQIQKAATQLRLFSQQQGKLATAPLFVNAAEVK